MIHFSFPMLLYGSDLLAPIELLGPLVNYLYIRYRGGDAQGEAAAATDFAAEKKTAFEQYRSQEGLNFMWPSLQQLQNQWVWVVVGAGALGAVIEQGVHMMNMP